MGQALVLVARSDPATGESVRKALEDDGLRVRLCGSAQEAIGLLRSELPDALVIDAFLPDRSGFAVCRMLREDRAARAIPILILTPESSEMDSILAFEAGADDAVARPFFARELALRVRALLRRYRRAGDGTPHDAIFVCGPITIDLAQRSVRVLGVEARLSEREFAVLGLLARHPGRVFPRDEILRDAWQSGERRSARVVDAHVKGLRRKLGVAGRLVETVRGTGYRLCEPDRLERVDALLPGRLR